MRRLRLPTLLLILLAALLGACGKTLPTRTVTVQQHAPAITPFVCQPRVPPMMGECIRQELEHHNVKPARPKLGALAPALRGHVQGIDISRWQPHPAFRELYRQGIRFVIVQGADNAHASNPFFASQVREAHEAGMQVGVYIFAEGDSSTAQADTLVAVAARERSRITLGAYVDAEVPSAYARTCGIVSVLAHHFWIVGVYGSPGTYRGGSCRYSWPAEWSSASASPLPGFSFASMKLRQWCGTCQMAGVGEVDRDEDLGAIALSHVRAKPKPKPLTRRQAEALLVQVNRLLGAYDQRRNPHGHNCQHPPYPHAYPSAAYNHPCAVWAAEARALRRRIG
jgi:Glycosyl hydrolases family 25